MKVLFFLSRFKLIKNKIKATSYQAAKSQINL